MAGQLTIDTLKASTGVLATQNGMTGIAKAWVNFNGVTTATIRSSFNVSSVTRNSTGDYTVNFTTAMPDANYSQVVNVASANPTIAVAVINATSASFAEAAPTTTSFRFVSINTAASAYYDTKYASVSVFSA